MGTPAATAAASRAPGLVLAVARGFAWSMAGEIVDDDTPGGGTTMTVELEASR